MKKPERLTKSLAVLIAFIMVFSVFGGFSVKAETITVTKTEKNEEEDKDSKSESEIRILPEVLHCDDTLINQVTIPGPDAGDYSQYQPEMFYGRWRIEDDGKNSSKSVTKEVFDDTMIDVRGEESPAEVLPWYMAFGIYDKGSIYQILPLYLDTANTGYISFGVGETSSTEHGYMMVYDVSGDTLAIGFTDVTRDEILEGKYDDIHVVRELHYQIVKWDRCQLTLRYGNRETTYIPDSKLNRINDEYQISWDRQGYLSKNSTPMGNPYSISKSGTAYFNNGLDDWSISSSLTLEENGEAKLEITDGYNLTFNYVGGYATQKEGRDGKAYGFVLESYTWYDENAARLYLADHMNWDYEAYYYSQNALTLRYKGNNLVYLSNKDYDNHHLVWDFDAEVLWLPAETKNLEDTSYYLEEEKHEENLGYTVGDLIDLGFETEADVKEKIRSRIVCEVFEMTKDGVSFDVRAVNPYGESIPLNDCIVCYFGFDDTTGKVTLDGEIGCGKSKKEDVTGYYRKPFIEKEDHVVYQTSNPSHDYDNEYGDFVISEDVSTADVLFRFNENEELTQIVFLAPYLLYNTLAGNLGEIDLGSLDPDDLDETMRVRDEILDLLKEAFEEEGIEVDIDELTGKITLDNKILFGFDRYDLTDDGKKYIDSFLKAYAQVLLDEEHAGTVKEVRFDGHTDTVGTYDYNMELSKKRANAVLEYCLGKNKADLTKEQTEAFEKIATTAGHSFTDPIYGEDGKVDMDASRRVEVNFFLNIPGAQTEG